MATKKSTSKTAATKAVTEQEKAEQAEPITGAAEQTNTEAAPVATGPEAASEATEATEAGSSETKSAASEFLFATDDEGNPIADQDSGAAFTRPKTLTFTLNKQTQRAEVLGLNVPARFEDDLTGISARLALEVGYLPGETIAPTKSGDEGEEAEIDERFLQLVRLTNDSPELRAVHAQIAASATVRDNEGRARTSLPYFHDLTPEKLLASGVLGDSYINAVMAWWRSIQ